MTSSKASIGRPAADRPGPSWPASRLGAWLRRGAVALSLALTAAAPGTAATVCNGRDLMAEMPAETAAQLREAVAGVPFAHGTMWQATRRDARIVLVGTYHFDDPRLDAQAAALGPLLTASDALMVEAGPEEEAALKHALAADPSLIVDATGKTLPERLTPEEWDALSDAMAARGVPPILVSRMRPWYVSMLLGISPCMLAEMRKRGDGDIAGLDRRLMRMAARDGVPVAAVEPYDTVFRLFDGLSPDDALASVRAGLIEAEEPDDFSATTTEAFFRGEVWELWEWSRLRAYEDGSMSRDEVDRQMALMQEVLMDSRNARWIAPLEARAEKAGAKGKPVMAAVGALHLPGEKGVLRLLERKGWTVAPLDLPAAEGSDGVPPGP